MIINSDHSIITTPVESPRTETDGSSIKLPLHAGSDETPTPDTSTSEAAEKNKRHRPKARSESNRSEKYAKVFLFRFYCYLIGCLHSPYFVTSF